MWSGGRKKVGARAKRKQDQGFPTRGGGGRNNSATPRVLEGGGVRKLEHFRILNKGGCSETRKFQSPNRGREGGTESRKFPKPHRPRTNKGKRNYGVMGGEHLGEKPPTSLAPPGGGGGPKTRRHTKPKRQSEVRRNRKGKVRPDKAREARWGPSQARKESAQEMPRRIGEYREIRRQGEPK